MVSPLAAHFGVKVNKESSCSVLVRWVLHHLVFWGLGVGRMLLKADETIGPWRRAPRLSVCRREPRAGMAPQQMALSLAARDLLCAQDDRVPLKPSVAPQVGPSAGAVTHASVHTLLEDRGWAVGPEGARPSGGGSSTQAGCSQDTSLQGPR